MTSAFSSTPQSSPRGTTISTFSFMSNFSSVSRSRLQSLYSDFSGQKNSNPASYQANVDWWRRTLETYLSQGTQPASRLVLQARQRLIDDFRADGVGKPIGLGAVITELLTSSTSSQQLPTLLPLATFFSLASSIYSPKSRLSHLSAIPSLFLSYVVAKPLWWTLEQVGVVGEDSISSTIAGMFSSGNDASRTDHSWFGDYVILTLVERAGEAVIEKQRNKTTGPADALYSFELFREEFSDCLCESLAKEKAGSGVAPVSMSELDAKVLVRYLERDKGALIVNDGVIKFVEASGSLQRACEITAVDKGILELKVAVTNLHAQVYGIQLRIDRCIEKASDALRQQRKPLALSYLRSRKECDGLLGKRLGALNNLEGTLMRVEAAAADIEIMNSYSSSAATLQAILSHPSLQRESIEQVMDAMAEANSDAREIDDAVRLGGDLAVGVSDGIDEADLEEELRNLLKEDGQTEKESLATQSKLAGLPSLPLAEQIEHSEESRVRLAATS